MDYKCTSNSHMQKSVYVITVSGTSLYKYSGLKGNHVKKIGCGFGVILFCGQKMQCSDFVSECVYECNKPI